MPELVETDEQEFDDPLEGLDDRWPSARLKFVTEINPDSVSGEEPDDWEIEYVDISSVNNRGEIRETDEMPFGEAPSRAQRLVQDGDTIVSTVRTYLRAIAFVEESPPNRVVSTGFAVLRPTEKLDPRFLWRCLQADPFIEWIVANSKGVSYPAINPSRLGDLVVPVPPLEEQKTIVDFLDYNVSQINELIDKKIDLIDALEEKRASTITKTTTQGLNLNPLLKTLDSRWFDEIPAHWEIKRLDHLRDPYIPIVYGIVLPGPDQDQGVPIIKGGDCKPEKLDPDKLSKTTQEIADDYERSRLQAGELVYEIRGSVGRVVKVPPGLEGANLTQDTARIAPMESIDTDWLLYALQSETFRQQMDLHTRGATVQGVNLFDLRRGLIPVPPLSEQKEIATHLKETDQEIENLQKRIEQGIDLLEEKRQAIVTKAVTGQIDVADWSPSERQEISI